MPLSRFRGDSVGRPTSRSSRIGHPERSPIVGDGLWTVPELWKTHSTRFPQARLDGAQNAPPTTAHKAFLFITEEERKRNDYNNALHSRRLIDNTDVPASLRSDHDGLE